MYCEKLWVTVTDGVSRDGTSLISRQEHVTLRRRRRRSGRFRCCGRRQLSLSQASSVAVAVAVAILLSGHSHTLSSNPLVQVPTALCKMRLNEFDVLAIVTLVAALMISG